VLREDASPLHDDRAMQAARTSDLDDLELFTATAAARSVAEKAKRISAYRAA
jgi:hypothetical protein